MSIYFWTTFHCMILSTLCAIYACIHPLWLLLVYVVLFSPLGCWKQTLQTIRSVAVFFIFYFQRFVSQPLSQNLLDWSSPHFQGWQNYGCRWSIFKFFFDTPGDVSMANCQLVFVGFDRRWLVMQQGGLTLGIVLRLISCFLYCIILFYCHFLCGPRIFVATYCYYC